MMSNDTIPAVLKTFTDYSIDFGKLDPNLIPVYFHLPAMLMTAEIVAVMTDENKVKDVFKQLFDKLKLDKFKESKLDSLKISEVSQNQAIVTGVATRYREDGSVLEHFGLTYTLRHTDNGWKIIVGVLHDPNEFSASVPLKG
jgi:hypothetical protein